MARALRDSGCEVIYTGLHQSPEQIIATAIQEDAQAIGLSILSGAHMSIFERILTLLKENNAQNIVIFGGGIIPEADRQALKDKGVGEIFTPGATTQEIITWLQNAVGANSK